MMRFCALTLACACMLTPSSAAVSFFSIGDWGGKDVGTEASNNVDAVAAAMKEAAATYDPEFVVQTGDSFYFCGLENTTDPQIQVDWVLPFVKSTGLNLKWYGVLGNHEYGYQPQAVVDMGKIYPNWIQDDRYYSRRVEVSPSVYMTMIFLDTSPCITDYRGDDQSKWDPCGGDHPTCAGGPVEGSCDFHENILATPCTPQVTWLKTTLAAVNPDDWLIVVGHAPAWQVTEFDLVTMLEDANVDLYLNGHVHTLEQYTVDSKGLYVTTGAGSLCRAVSDEEVELEPTKAEPLHVDTATVSASHSYESVWNQVVAGFTIHTFSSDFKTLTTTFVDNKLNKLHSFDATKGGGPSPPPPTGACCHYSDSSCATGDVCCKSECTDPSKCSYTKEGCDESPAKKHNCSWDSSTDKCIVA